MRILHCCLANFYIDGYGYQENILPKMHKLQGLEVRIVASTETFIDNRQLGYIAASQYVNENNIPVTRLPYVKFLPHKIASKLRLYNGLKNELVKFAPDIIFLHDIQFLSIRTVVEYVKKFPKVIVYADSHTDYINSARTWFSKNILHSIIYKKCAQMIEPHVKKFYGTLPIRNDFLVSVYNIPEDKIELLELGADDSLFDFEERDTIRRSKRMELGIEKGEIVLITGGKIDELKNIHLLVEAFKQLEKNDIKLLVFGEVNEKMDYLVKDFENIQDILYVGWQNPAEIYSLLFASDIAVFPGTHSVLWEQVTGVGLPAIFKSWRGMKHVDLGGNCLFLDDVSSVSIKSVLLSLVKDKAKLAAMRSVAMSKGIKKFSYSNIAARAIEKNKFECNEK